MKKINLTVLAIHPPFKAPNERFRFEQYRQYLLNNSVFINYIYIISEKENQILFSQKYFLLKFLIYLKSYFKRWKQILTLNKCDTILIYRELHWFYFGTKFWMKILKRKSNKIIFDFDDAIWLQEKNTIAQFLKQPQRKFQTLTSNSHKVIAGNSYLAHYAQQYNPHTHIIPTVVDTDYYTPLPHLRNKKNILTIGWMGSYTTIEHFKMILPVLQIIKQKYPYVQFKVIGKKEYLPEIDTYAEAWNKENELHTLNSFDIGLMPIPNDEWSKGKCGLKLLTYMACGVPCVASNVGVNKEIIDKTQGGFYCNDENEWMEKLSLLIENKTLREQLGQQGRKNVEKYYSLKTWREELLNIILN